MPNFERSKRIFELLDRAHAVCMPVECEKYSLTLSFEYFQFQANKTHATRDGEGSPWNSFYDSHVIFISKDEDLRQTVLQNGEIESYLNPAWSGWVDGVLDNLEKEVEIQEAIKKKKDKERLETNTIEQGARMARLEAKGLEIFGTYS